MRHALLLAGLLVLGSCAAPAGVRPALDEGRPPPRAARWPVEHAVMQGFLGAYDLDTVERKGGSLDPVDGSERDLARLPAFGGGGQWKLGGERIDLGLEALFSVGWRANAFAFASGSGGATVAVDVDMFLLDIYGGPFVSTFLGERWRAYAAAGPLLQWAEYDQGAQGDAYDGNGSGFGTGWYARTGLEYLVRPGLAVGAGVRYSDSRVSLDGDLGDLHLAGVQWAVTFSSGI